MRGASSRSPWASQRRKRSLLLDNETLGKVRILWGGPSACGGRTGRPAILWLGTLLTLITFLSAAETPKPGLACSSCHTQQASTQPATSMARAMLLPGRNTVLERHPTLTVQKGAFTYQVET